MNLRAEGLVITFPEYSIKAESIVIHQHENLELRAPSGFGKTTLLRAIAGFVPFAQGKLWVGSREITHLPPHKRNIGFVFQDHLLFSHLNAEENASFALKIRGFSKREQQKLVQPAMDALGLASRRQAAISELSGGERQRLALIRATVYQPDLLLLDEPFNGLDPQAVQAMTEYLGEMQKSKPTPVVSVSHLDVKIFENPKILIGRENGKLREFLPQE